MNKEKPFPAAALSLGAAALIVVEGIYTAIVQSPFAFSWDATNLLYYFLPGCVLVLCGLLLLRLSAHSRVLGVGIVFLALWSLFTGGGFLVGTALGVLGGVLAVAWKSRMLQPLNLRFAKMPKRSRLLILVAVVVLAVLVVMPTEVAYQLSVNDARQQTLAKSRIVDTASGPIEYADVGTGYPVLVSHGAGMGYLQVDSVEQIFGNQDFRFIVPSRFGYMRTPMPTDGSFAAQADAFAQLLDVLNISKVVIMGISINGPAALEFALRYPERCSALIMVDAISHDTPELDLTGELIHQVMFRSNFGFWMLSNDAQPTLLSFLGVSGQVQANMTEAEKQYVNDLIGDMQPIGIRQSGLVNDAVRSETELNLPLQQIHMPTLVFHTKDDEFVNFEYGQFTAQHIAGAEFVALPSGGHLLVGQLNTIRTDTVNFLTEHQILG